MPLAPSNAFSGCVSLSEYALYARAMIHRMYIYIYVSVAKRIGKTQLMS